MARYIMVVIFVSIALVSMVQADKPAGFRGASAIPDEYFTCKNRAPGKYADDKRSCALFWTCSETGELLHTKCPDDKPVFDDRVRECVKGEPGKCPVDYGFFQTAGSFCRGRPHPVPKMLEHLQPLAQAYYVNLMNNCDSYFWCFIVAEGQSTGFEFKCPMGQKFDWKTAACKAAKFVMCPVSHGADLVEEILTKLIHVLT